MRPRELLNEQQHDHINHRKWRFRTSWLQQRRDLNHMDCYRSQCNKPENDSIIE